MGILDIDLTGPSIPRFLGLEDEKIKQAPGGWLPVEVHKSQVLSPIPKSPSEPSPLNENHTSTQDDVQSPNNSPDISTRPRTDAPPPTLPPNPIPHTPTSPKTDLSIPIGALHAISLAFLLPTRSSAVIWRGPKKTAMVRQFLTDVLWPPSGIDYLLIDTPPGTSDEHIALAESLLSSTSNHNPDIPQPRLAGAVIVTTPQAVAVSDVRKEINFCKKTGIDVLGVVENMAGFVCECCGEETNLFGKGGGELMASEFGIRFLGRVAMDAAWGRLIEEGRRPRYAVVSSAAEEEGGEEVEIGEFAVEKTQYDGLKKEEGLLVDKYRNCRLCETFEGITRQLVELVEEDLKS